MFSETVYTNFFREADTDRDGFLNFNELIAILKRSGQTDKKARSYFDTVNTSADGKISLEEFLSAMGVVEPKNYKEMLLRSTFNSFDTDRSGKIEKHELRKVFAEMEKVFTVQEIEKMIKMGDADGDGTLDYEEFIKKNFGSS